MYQVDALPMVNPKICHFLPQMTGWYDMVFKQSNRGNDWKIELTNGERTNLREQNKNVNKRMSKLKGNCK